MRTRTVAIVAFALAAACVGASRASAEAAGREVRPSAASETIAYSRCTATKADYCAATGLFSSRADGSRQRLLVPNASSPAWSPNGRRIAYDGPGGIWVARADGSGRRRLTTAPRRGDDIDPSWSPDGRRIVFHREWEVTVDELVVDLYAVTVGTKRLVRLTRTPDIWEFDPAWSPDGRHIAYDRGMGDDTAKAGIHALDLATGRSRRLTRSRGSMHSAPDWSPDGTRIAFAIEVDPSAIVVMKRNGSGRRKIVSSRKWASSPSWSPDGSRIAYTLNGDVNSDDEEPRIVVAQSDGTSPRLVVPGGSEPDWRPHG